MAWNGINNPRKQNTKEKKGKKLNALCHCSRHDRDRCPCQNQLKEEFNLKGNTGPTQGTKNPFINRTRIRAIIGSLHQETVHAKKGIAIAKHQTKPH